MAQEFEDITGTDVLGLQEPDDLFPDVIDATPTPAAAAARALVKVDLRAVTLARFGDWKPTATALVARIAAKTYPDIQTPAGLKEATADRAALRDPRLKAQKVAEAAKKQLRAVAADVGEELDAITAILEPEEKRVGAVITAENERREKAREAAREAEAARQRQHEANLAKIRGFVDAAKVRDVDGIRQLIDMLSQMQVGEAWQEYAEPAKIEQRQVIEEMERIAAEKVAEQEEAEARRQAEAATRARQAELDAQEARLAEQQAALATQQRAVALLTEWATLPAKYPVPGDTDAEFFRTIAQELQEQAPDALTFGPLLPAALVTYSTALSHMSELVGGARDIAMRREAAARESAKAPPVPFVHPALPPVEAPAAPTPAGVSETAWAESAVKETVADASRVADQAQILKGAVEHDVATDGLLDGLNDRGPLEADPMTATLNMGALNERFGFIMKREFVEESLHVPARREERKASFWTEDDYLLIAARLALRMEVIVEAGIKAAA